MAERLPQRTDKCETSPRQRRHNEGVAKTTMSWRNVELAFVGTKCSQRQKSPSSLLRWESHTPYRSPGRSGSSDDDEELPKRVVAQIAWRIAIKSTSSLKPQYLSSHRPREKPSSDRNAHVVEPQSRSYSSRQQSKLIYLHPNIIYIFLFKRASKIINFHIDVCFWLCKSINTLDP